MPIAVPRPRDLRAVLALTHECRDLGDDPAGWRRHWAAGLARVLDADMGYSGELGGLTTGRHHDLGNAIWGLDHGFDAAGYVAGMAHLRANPGYTSTLAAYAVHPAAGTGLSVLDLLSLNEWERTPECQIAYRVVGAGGPLYCLTALPRDADVATGEVFCRRAGRPDFTARQKAVLTEANALLRPLVGGPLARFADPSPAHLPPRAPQVLRCRLEGATDNQAAVRLGMRPASVNAHVKRIFAHFAVATRAELLARWVRRGWGKGFAWADSPAGPE